MRRLKVLELLQEVYDPDVRAAIHAYNSHLNSLRAQLQSRANAAKRAIAEYEDDGSDDLNEIADRYAKLRKEAEEIKRQIGRLGGDWVNRTLKYLIGV